MDWVSGEIDSVIQGTLSTLTPTCRWVCEEGDLVKNFTDPTLMATRVWGSTRPNGTTTANDVIAFGIIAWNFTRDATGTLVIPTECPDLFNDPDCQDEDWVYRYFRPSSGGEGPGDVLYLNDSDDRMSKARRRLGNDQGILMVVQGVGAFHFHFHASFLIKE
jgi:hypothetical protein